MVVLEAEHMCMTMRGVKKPGSKTVSIATRGAFEGNAELQNRFFQMLHLNSDGVEPSGNSGTDCGEE